MTRRYIRILNTPSRTTISASKLFKVFLATTLTSAVTRTIVTIINDPSSVITLLSTSIPRTSSFYLSYFVLQGLGVSTRILVSVMGFLTTPLLAKTLGSTPRKIWQRWNQLSGVGWGTLYPVYTNLLVIGTDLSIFSIDVLIVL